MRSDGRGSADVPTGSATLTADGAAERMGPVQESVSGTDGGTAGQKGDVQDDVPVPPEAAEDDPLRGKATLTADGSEAPRAAAAVSGAVEIPPSLYARFEGFQVAGRGGMGTVYRARDLRLGRTVAVKLLFHHDPKGGLLREARSQARLRHPNVCEVFEAGVADQVPFIVMRYIEGAPLQQVKGDMSLEEKVAAVRDVALALHEAHRIGLIHRDVKPGNILVERLEDGGFRPLITDFGIARDTSDAGVTMADSVQGTPAFMAPEQAAGRTRALDRRTDVYGLGATLYDALAGRPPITADSVLSLLRKVVEAEPVPLREAAAEIPADLEAIVMKCLEKDPAGRFESAKALAEDLQRFLDGDPVLARRSSWGARLWKRARKHKGKVAVATAIVAGALSLGGLWIRDRRVAGERAALSREMGGAVREMELFLRGAQALPLHDLERERDVVRGRLREIEGKMAAAGDVGRGPGEDALGRGYLALQDPAAALTHLRLAKEAGDDAPGLEYAMGLARIALYREALAKAKRIQKASEREAFIAEIEKEHKAPALAHLRAALTGGVESPAYAHGLIALIEGRLDEALARAEEAFAAAPWLYEAKKLEGDVLFAMGSQTGHDKAFDAKRTGELFERAAKAYAAAAEVGRSDPAVHEAECDLWIQAMNAAAEAGESMRPGFEKAKTACGSAIQASPRRASGHVKLAWAHNCFSFWAAIGHNDGGSPEKALSDAATLVDDAVKKSPGDAFASYLSGAVWRSHALYALEIGRDEGPALDRAITGYEAALALDPRFAWALNEECGSLAMRGHREARVGADPAATFERALGLCRRALEVDPDFLFPWANTLLTLDNDAERLVARGASPLAAIERGLEAAMAGEARHPEWRWGPVWEASLHRLRAEYDLARGEDPGPALALAERSLAKLAPYRASFTDGDATEGEIAAVTAEALLSRETSGERAAARSAALEEALARGRRAFTRALSETPWDLGYATWLTRVEVTELRYRVALGEATNAHAEAALAPLAPFFAEPRDNPLLYEVAARAREARAELRLRTAGDAGPDLQACVALAERAAAVGPGQTSGRAALGRCRLGLARIERDPRKTKELAKLAAEALGAVVRDNPLLARTHTKAWKEAESLAGGG